MAYVFMSDADGAQTWDADYGDNAVILQPGDFTAHVEMRELQHGPRLQEMLSGITGNRLAPVETEFRVQLDDMPDEAVAYEEFAFATRIGGPPSWLQSEEWPNGGPWKLFIQLDSTRQLGDLNFGDAGVGYALISIDGRHARFLWQCC